MNALPYLIEKEFKQMWRNRLLPIVFVLLPLALMNMVPRVATQEVTGLKFCVIDHAHTQQSRRLVEQINASRYLDLAAVCPSPREAMQLIDAAQADLLVEIARDGQVSVRSNATNGMKGAMGLNYVTQIVASANQANTSAIAQTVPAVSFLFNSHLDYKIYMIPCIFALMLTLIVGFLPALNIVGEKERGTIEQVNVTPIGKWEFILSKLIPYWVVGILMTLLALGASKAIYGIAPAGSVILIFLFVLVYCILASAFGLVISNYSRTVQQASLTMFFFLVIFILLSGLLTPIRSMPEWAQLITRLDPLSYLIDALRAIFIKGSTLADLRTQLLSLAGFACAMAAWAVMSYRKNDV